MARLVMLAVLLTATALPAVAQDASVVRSITITGVQELTEPDCLSAARIRVGEPLPDTPDQIAAAVERRYREADYDFARVTATWDPQAGALAFVVDEGRIDGVEFRGVDETLARELAADFALKAGDIFNRSRATEALRALLRPTRGAVKARHDPFEMNDTANGRQLAVLLRERAGRFHLAADLGDREDWFTSVDGFVPSLGFGAAVFDHTSFNHAFVSGHVSFKTTSHGVGYALGFEKPFFGRRKLFVGAEVHDLTASDGDWRVSSLEASLAAIGPRDSLRDYYRRRGVQLNATFRPQSRVEVLLAWRGERNESLPARTDFSLWHRDEDFRPNPAVAEGRLQALVVGASVDGAAFDRESLESTYRRHQLDTAFGERLPEVRGSQDEWRVDWQSEISSPGALGSDFDFTRSIVSARYRTMLSPHQSFGARLLEGWSTGTLPPQRLFAAGGIGSVIGYPFKTQVGSAMTLVNLEYGLGWRNGLRGFGLFDVGRTTAGGADAPWLKGVGVGVGIGDGFRIDFGYRLDAVPSSLQVLVRFGRTF